MVMKKIGSDDEANFYGDSSYVIADEHNHDTGCTIRDKKYRRRLLDAVKSNKGHPIFNGVVMSAHHLISIEGFKQSKLVARDIKYKGYNINYPKNLIFLPYETAGACHLGVQLHRGNHYELDLANRNYHQLVAHNLDAQKKKLRNVLVIRRLH